MKEVLVGLIQVVLVGWAGTRSPTGSSTAQKIRGCNKVSIISLKKVEPNLIKAQQAKIGLKHEVSKNKIKSSCQTP